jgi:hypothetical protein
MNVPNPPAPQPPAKDWKHRDLYDRVRETLFALPAYFKPETFIAGLLATDIFSLNAALGATIEAQVVDALNDLRASWDPNRQYAPYNFVRHPQTFPAVSLQRFKDDGSAEILFGIELKGWYLLAKEGEPSFRFHVSPGACAPADILAVFPWALTNVISGRPQLFRPFVVEAQYAAEFRNHYWEHQREGKASNIIRAANPRPYPEKADEVSDHAEKDTGDNFARLARTAIMDPYKRSIDQEGISGIPVGLWREFFKAFVSGKDSVAVEKTIRRLAARVSAGESNELTAHAKEILQKLEELVRLIS